MSNPQQEEEKAVNRTKSATASKRPDWNLLVGIISLCVALVCGAIAIATGFLQTVTGIIGPEIRTVFNLDRTPIPSPTPQAFAPAKPGESLIIVADFEPRPKDVKLKDDPAQYIYEELKEQVRKDNLDIRVERLRQVVDDSTARPTGEVYSATMLLWGWYGDIAVNPRIERFGLQTTYVSDEESQRISLANPERISDIVLNYLPNQVKYVVFLILSLEKSKSATLDEALNYADAAIGSVQPGGQTNAAEAYLLRGWIYLGKREPDRAIADYDQAIALKPDDATAFFNRGVAYVQKREYDRAIKVFDQVIALKPDDATAFNNRGGTYSLKGEFDRAIKDFDQATTLKPNDAEAFYNRGLLYALKGEFDRAIADFDQAITLKPNFAEAFNNRGNANAGKGERDRAIADYDQAIALKPDNAKAFFNRGVAYVQKREYDRAIKDFDQAIALKPDNAEAFAARGAAFYLKIDKVKAMADLEKALELSKDPSLRADVEELIKQIQ